MFAGACSRSILNFEANAAVSAWSIVPTDISASKTLARRQPPKRFRIRRVR
ncbi:hypothetical protein [Saccharopolyspora thermophila]|uniref:hypothetical protein n=1 Tax=Saccharopolyspora thermophila TaxID=89367 RepID=UPI001669A457|nr:hypothetical protein [Saccharopolyspora subtropica]